MAAAIEAGSPAGQPGRPHFRLPRSARLRKRREFLAVNAHPRRESGRFFVVLASSPPASTPDRALARRAPVRLGVTVSKKVGNAVVRNRIERRIRECFRHQKDFSATAMGAAGLLDIVVIARPSAGKTAFADCQGDLSRLFSRLQGAR